MGEAATKDNIWDNLCAWIRSHEGGKIHDGLKLATIGGSSTHRGIFADRDISVGETLINLPRSLAVFGEHLPSSYHHHHHQESSADVARNVSPWLRCLAAYYEAKQQQDDQKSKKPYLDSLPSHYETVSISWEKAEIDSFLSGTSTQGGGGWHHDEALVRERYNDQIRPYLVFCKLLSPVDTDDESNADKEARLSQEIQEFLHVSQCLSTRCFHLQSNSQPNSSTNETSGTSNSSASAYTGPFLLPWIDLLNHSIPRKCTTLQSDANSFVMRAERNIAAGEEILHSYGDDLTCTQFLQTFGFVEQALLQLRASSEDEPYNTDNQPTWIPGLSSVLVDKHLILQSCWDVIDSDFPQRLKTAMEEAEMEDETWTIQVDRTRSTDFLPESIAIGNSGGGTFLSDELVTLSCVPFLPRCAYREAARSMIGAEILEDFYLGNLVCKSLMSAISKRLDQYKPILWEGVERDDQQLLQELLTLSEQGHDATATRSQRAMHGIALRLEEKATLRALQKEIIQILANLEDECQVEGIEEDNSTKRARVT